MAGGGAVPHAILVVTHEKRDAWERPGATTVHFVNDGIETALDRGV